MLDCTGKIGNKSGIKAVKMMNHIFSNMRNMLVHRIFSRLSLNIFYWFIVIDDSIFMYVKEYARHRIIM